MFAAPSATARRRHMDLSGQRRPHRRQAKRAGTKRAGTKSAGTSLVHARRLWKGSSISSRATENGPAFCECFVCAQRSAGPLARLSVHPDMVRTDTGISGGPRGEERERERERRRRERGGRRGQGQAQLVGETAVGMRAGDAAATRSGTTEMINPV